MSYHLVKQIARMNSLLPIQQQVARCSAFRIQHIGCYSLDVTQELAILRHPCHADRYPRFTRVVVKINVESAVSIQSGIRIPIERTPIIGRDGRLLFAVIWPIEVFGIGKAIEHIPAVAIGIAFAIIGNSLVNQRDVVSVFTL